MDLKKQKTKYGKYIYEILKNKEKVFLKNKI